MNTTKLNKIKRGDEVVILSGKDKGKQGKVQKILRKSGRVIIEGINLVKKTVKANPQRNQQGGIVEREASLSLSNVALYNPMTKRADKVGFKVIDGRKVRYFKSNNEVVDIG